MVSAAAGDRGAPWAGIVRLECSADLEIAEAVWLADLSLVTLPRFASSPYKDPRAPQNLVPIAGLERLLRSRLGDARLLHRALTVAARTAAARPAADGTAARRGDTGLAELVPDPDRSGSWTLLLDGVPQSHVDLTDPTHLEFEYVRRLAAAIDLVAPAGARCGCCIWAAVR